MGEDSSILGTRNVWWINVMFWSSQDTMELLQKAGATAWDLKAFWVREKRREVTNAKRHPFVCLRIHLTLAGKAPFLTGDTFSFMVLFPLSVVRFLCCNLLVDFFTFYDGNSLLNHHYGEDFFPTNRSLTSSKVCLEQITEVIQSQQTAANLPIGHPQVRWLVKKALKIQVWGIIGNLPKIQYTTEQDFSRKSLQKWKSVRVIYVCDVMPIYNTTRHV